MDNHMTLQESLNKFWEEDPGFFRLKQAFKTVIALLLLGIITYTMPQFAKFFSALAAGFAMQAIVGDTRKQQIKFILLAYPIYLLCFFLGYFTKTNILLSSVFLVALGFLAIYVKKYGAAFFFAPIIAWCFAFLATILPVYSLSIGMLIFYMLLGMLIGALVYLFIFPELKSSLFDSNLRKFFHAYAMTLQWLAYLLVHKTDVVEFQRKREQHKNYLFRLTMVNGDIMQNNCKNNETITRMNKLYIKQYALAKISSMIMEALDLIIREKIEISDDVRSHLFTVFAIYATAIANIDIQQTHSNYREVINTLTIMEKNLNEFQSLILACVINQKKSMTALINLNLGLRLILRNIRKMEQIYEK